MHLVERQREFGILKQLFTRCRNNRGQVALVTGGVAHGKTELLSEFIDYAAKSDALLITAAASRSEQTIRFGVMRQLLGGAPLPSLLEQRVSNLLNQYELSRGPGGEDSSKESREIHAVHELCTVILELAREQPVVLAVDDVQFIDSQSLEALLYLQRRMRLSRILMIFNEWTQPRPTQPPLHAEFARLPYFSRISLGPLSEAGVAEVIAQHPDVMNPHLLASSIHQASGGNPLLVGALIEDYLEAARTEGDDWTGEAPAGGSFREALLACLHRWEPRLLQVAQGIALLGEFGSPPILARLLQLTADSAAQVVDVLTMAGLLVDGDFRNPVARTAVLNSIDPAELITLHLRSADLLYVSGKPAFEVARHLLSAGEANEHWAVSVLCEAANDALTEDQVALAVNFLNLARQVCADEQERAAVTAKLAQIEWRVRPTASSVHIPRLRTAVRDGYLDDSATVLIKYLLWHGLTEEAGRTLTKLLDSAADGGPPELASELRLNYHLLSYSFPPFFPRTPERLVFTDELEKQIMVGTPWARGSAALASALEGGPSETAISGAEHVLQSTLLTDETLDLLLIALLTLIYADQPDRAAQWCGSLLDEAVHRNARTWQALLSNIRADIAMRQGDLALAADCARAALEHMSPRNWGVSIGTPLSTLMLATTAMGEFDEAAALLKQTVPSAMFSTWFAPQYLHARGHYFLATKKIVAALGDFQQCGTLMTSWQIDQPAIAPWRSDTALAYIELGKLDEARKLITEQLELPNLGIRVQGMSLRILAATRETQERIPLLDKAVCLQRASGDRIELAMSLAELGRARYELGEFDIARQSTNESISLAKRSNSLTFCRSLFSGHPALHDDDSATKVVSERRVTLSRAEWRVASLAALGHTNNVISRKLSITVSTVEQHLTRVYRKLKVNRRSELPGTLTGTAGRVE